jgi:hypothetical protein
MDNCFLAINLGGAISNIRRLFVTTDTGRLEVMKKRGPCCCIYVVETRNLDLTRFNEC